MRLRSGLRPDCGAIQWFRLGFSDKPFLYVAHRFLMCEFLCVMSMFHSRNSSFQLGGLITQQHVFVNISNSPIESLNASLNASLSGKLNGLWKCDGGLNVSGLVQDLRVSESSGLFLSCHVECHVECHVCSHHVLSFEVSNDSHEVR